MGWQSGIVKSALTWQGLWQKRIQDFLAAFPAVIYFCAKALLMLSEGIKAGFTPRIFWSLAFTHYLTQFIGYTCPQHGTEMASQGKCAFIVIFCLSYSISWEVCINPGPILILYEYITEMYRICDSQRKKKTWLDWPTTQKGRPSLF